MYSFIVIPPPFWHPPSTFLPFICVSLWTSYCSLASYMSVSTLTLSLTVSLCPFKSLLYFTFSIFHRSFSLYSFLPVFFASVFLSHFVVYIPHFSSLLSFQLLFVHVLVSSHLSHLIVYFLPFQSLLFTLVPVSVLVSPLSLFFQHQGHVTFASKL